MIDFGVFLSFTALIYLLKQCTVNFSAKLSPFILEKITSQYSVLSMKISNLFGTFIDE